MTDVTRNFMNRYEYNLLVSSKNLTYTVQAEWTFLIISKSRLIKKWKLSDFSWEKRKWINDRPSPHQHPRFISFCSRKTESHYQINELTNFPFFLFFLPSVYEFPPQQLASLASPKKFTETFLAYSGDSLMYNVHQVGSSCEFLITPDHLQ